jgi:hypothetical protein
MQPFRVLCASGERWLSTAHLPRLLHLAGAHVTFLGPRDAWPMRGSFVDDWVPADGGNVAVARALGEHLSSAGHYDWVIVGDDHLLRALTEVRHEPWMKDVLPIEPDDIRIGLMGSKIGFVRAAAALELPTPWSRVCLGAHEIGAAMREIGGPILVKEDTGSGGDGCHLVEDAHALERLPPHIGERPVVVQAFLRGAINSMEALYDRGRLLCVLTSQITRTWPAPFGPSAARHFFHHPGLLQLAEEVGRKVQLHGFGNLTAVDDPGGRPLLFELDPRPNALFHLGDTLGVDVTGALRDILERRPPGPPRHLAPTLRLDVPVYPVDVVRSAYEIDLKGLLAWAFNLDGRWRWVPQGDPRLASAYRQYVARQLVRRTLPVSVRGLAVRLWRR